MIIIRFDDNNDDDDSSDNDAKNIDDVNMYHINVL